ncbi:MAG: dUTP diphosphatase [Cyanobacteria bacterium REEB65]|nr:dUTP diphosphatase [Cyanobacteria bacterium REEB65]
MLQTVPIRIKRLSDNATVPKVMQDGDVAADLYAACDMLVPARGRSVVPTDLAIELPAGYRARIHGRSGLGAKHGIDVGAGLIDQSFRGNVSVLLFNHSDGDYEVRQGDRIAQLCIERYVLPTFLEVDDLTPTARSEGWGSSGR